MRWKGGRRSDNIEDRRGSGPAYRAAGAAPALLRLVPMLLRTRVGRIILIGGVVLGMVEQAEPLVIPGIGALQPWQQTFVYVGTPGLLLAFAFLLLREPGRRAPPASTGSVGLLLAFYRKNKLALAAITWVFYLMPCWALPSCSGVCPTLYASMA